MTPIRFADCFGWYHAGSPPVRRSGVVLCNSLSQEELAGYAGLRDLADALALQGYPTLRIHYEGAGNSLHPDGLEFFTVWQSNIDQAADWLRANTDVDRIALCGLRFGALLAGLVASRREDVAALILLAPVLRGKTHMHHLMVQTGQADGTIEVGFRLSAQTVRQISESELRRITLSTRCAVLVRAPSVPTQLTECAQHWLGNGVTVTVDGFAGLTPLLRPSFANHEAPADVSSLVAWVSGVLPAYHPAPRLFVPPPARFETPEFVETPLYFGDQPLFGILCEPPGTACTRVVVMANSGGDAHCNSATVDLARQLARCGVAALRMDFSGLADSPAQPPSHIFETDRQGDFAAAIDALQVRGYTVFAVQGLCSGAYHAYHAALRDARIGYAVLINLPFFTWIKGYAVAELVFDQRKPTDIMQMASRRVFWLTLWHKMLHGELLIRKRFAWLERKIRQVPGFVPAARHDAHGAAVSSTKLLFLSSEGDVSAEVVTREFGSNPPSCIRIVTSRELDHSMTRTMMRQFVARTIVDFMDEVPQPAKAFQVRVGLNRATRSRMAQLLRGLSGSGAVSWRGGYHADGS